MPHLWFTQEPPAAPGNGLPLTLSFNDFSTAFGDKRVRFFSGHPPRTPANTPSMEPQHVLLEVGADETKPPMFSQPGYYLIEGLSPAAAETALRRIGISV